MQICLTRWRSLVILGALFTAVVVGTSACQSTSAAVDADLARDLGLVDPSEVGISATRLERLDDESRTHLVEDFFFDLWTLNDQRLHCGQPL